MTVIWSSGGGVQSTAIAIRILQGRLPVPDRAVIADTGRETQETWDYLDGVVNPALARGGCTVERLPIGDPPPLFNSKGTLLIPVFAEGGAKFANYCSAYWKREKVKQWAIAQGLTPAVNWLGFSSDEMRRVTTPRAGNWLLDYPLIFNAAARASRQECINLVESFGWPPAPKSSCWLCPNRSNAQWRHLRDRRPAEWAAAIAADHDIRRVKPDVYLHRDLVPPDLVALDTPDSDGEIALGCASGDCFV